MSRKKADTKVSKRNDAVESLEGENQNGSRLSSVTAAIRLLKQFSAQDVELGISALARNLDVSKSTAHRLASTLLAEGLLEQDPVTERYKLGLGIFTLGALVRQRLSVSAEAKGLITELRDEIKENVALAVLSGSQVTFVYDLESPLPVRVSSRFGFSKSALGCAEGIAMLANQPHEVLAAAFDRAGEPMLMNRREALMEEIEHARRHGFVVESDSAGAGAIYIAAPIRDATGAVIAAVGVAGPSQRITTRRLKTLAPKVIDTADAVSRRLGFLAPSSHSA